jgi:hypothetical protein
MITSPVFYVLMCTTADVPIRLVATHRAVETPRRVIEPTLDIVIVSPVELPEDWSNAATGVMV